MFYKPELNLFFFSSRRRHTISYGDWSSDVCSSDLCGGSLNNCTLSGNSALYSGGGACGGSLNNCIVTFNAAPQRANYDANSVLSYCCTTPLPPEGIGNISADPQLASASHLSPSSPCRAAGNAA